VRRAPRQHTFGWLQLGQRHPAFIPHEFAIAAFAAAVALVGRGWRLKP
jgi:hypothetical protein